MSFVQRDAGEIEGSFGLITTFDVIHDLAQPAAALDAIARSLAIARVVEGDIFSIYHVCTKASGL